MKYFKKLYHDGKVGAGKWKDGDGINYNPSNDYTVMDIDEVEYNAIADKMKQDTQKKESRKRMIELATIIKHGEDELLDMTDEREELTALKIIKEQIELSLKE